MFLNCVAFGSSREEEELGDAVDVGEDETVDEKNEFNLNFFNNSKSTLTSDKQSTLSQSLELKFKII